MVDLSIILALIGAFLATFGMIGIVADVQIIREKGGIRLYEAIITIGLLMAITGALLGLIFS